MAHHTLCGSFMQMLTTELTGRVYPAERKFQNLKGVGLVLICTMPSLSVSIQILPCASVTMSLQKRSGCSPWLPHCV